MILFFQKFSLKCRLVGLLLSFLVTLVFFVFFSGTPWGVAQLKQYSGGIGLLDSSPFYTPDLVQSVLTSWGDAGRTYYLQVLLPIDSAFPLVYAFFFSYFFLYLLKKINPKKSLWYLLPYVAGAAASFDLLENLNLLILTLLYPNLPSPLCWSAAVFTAGKWTFLILCCLGCAGLVIFHLAQRFSQLLKSSSPE